MKVVLRVDGGERIGMGHVVRSLVLAEALAERGTATTFAARNDAGGAWLSSRGAGVEAIEAAAGSPEDASATIGAARRAAASLVVTDGYAFRQDYLDRLVAAGLLVVSIDDLAAWPFPSALVINGGLGARGLRYRTAPGTRVLLGPEYLLLRRAFRPRPAPEPRRAERILACFGGSDPEDYTGKVLQAWATLRDRPMLDLVAGPVYAGLDALRKAAGAAGAAVHRDLDAEALAALMARADLAVASAGMVACELCAVGVPMIVSAISEDQRLNAASLAEAGAARRVEPLTPPALLDALRDLSADGPRLSAMGDAARRLVDGRGAERVAGAILELGPRR